MQNPRRQVSDRFWPTVKISSSELEPPLSEFGKHGMHILHQQTNCCRLDVLEECFHFPSNVFQIALPRLCLKNVQVNFFAAKLSK